MAQDYAASVSGSHIRITRLNADGTLMTGASASYVTKAFISLSITPEREDGDEFTQKTAAGEVCVSYKTPNTLKRVTIQIAICNPDPEFTEIATGGTLLTSGGQSVGWLAPLTGVDATPNGVAVEVWSKAIVNGKPASVNPYFHWVIPFAVLNTSGDTVIQNDILATAFEGWGVGNAGFDKGPNTPVWPWASDRSYGYARTASVPSGTGYQTVLPNA